MAEARSAVSYRVQQSSLLFVVSDEEIVLRINKNLLPKFLTSVRQTLAEFLQRVRNAFYNALFPAPPMHWGLLIAIPAGLMVSDNPRVAPLSGALWGMTTFLPSANWINATGQIVVVSSAVGTSLLLLISFIRRSLLRSLLSYQGWLYEEPKKQRKRVMIWGFFTKLLSGKYDLRITKSQPLLYSHQEALPRLYVPKVSDTCKRHLRSVKAILTPEEYIEMENQALQFQKYDAWKLQAYLVAKSYLTENYVTDWWEKYVYLRGRTPILINSNYYILDSRSENPPTHVPVARAANLCNMILQFKQTIDTERLQPLVIRDTVPMCMKQYERLFNCNRIPGKEYDILKQYNSNHIAVLRKGHYYKMIVYHEDGSILEPWELETQFKWIIANAQRDPKPSAPESQLAAMTTENRTVWAETREEYFSGGINSISLEMIESAIFIVSLETEEYGNDFTKMSQSLFHGNGINRWCDKSFNMVVFGNAKAGLHVEHSWADAPVIAHMWEHVLIVGEHKSRGYDENGYNKRPADLKRRMLQPPQRLRWDFSVKLEKIISTAVENAEKLITDIDLQVVPNTTFGKGMIKKCRISPDAFIQLAFQLAYHKQNKKFPLTYESSMTRLFKAGRTETVRPATIEAASFVHAMVHPNSTKEEKIAALKAAADIHQQGYRDAMTGKGVDRHLFALYLVSVSLNMKCEYLQNALSMPWKLSTSQQPQNQTGLWDPSKPENSNKLCPGGGFGPVADIGYGVSYMIAGEDAIYFHISSKKSCEATNSRKFGEEVVKCLEEMGELFQKE